MPMDKVTRIDLSPFDGGVEIVSIVETDGAVRFALQTDTTGMAPPEWGAVLCDLLRDLAAGFARRGVVDGRGRQLSQDEVQRVMMDTLTEEFASGDGRVPKRLRRTD